MGWDIYTESKAKSSTPHFAPNEFFNLGMHIDEKTEI